MKTFVPAESFEAYPNDARTVFTKGVETAAYPADFVDLMVEKKLVEGKPKDVGTGAGKRPVKDDEPVVSPPPGPAD